MEHLNGIEISNPRLVTIDLSEDMSKAFALMKAFSVRHLVVTRDDKAIGILSDRDVMRAINVQVHDFYSVRVKEESFSKSVKVADVMGWPVHTLESSVPLTEMLNMMIEKKISCVLLTDASKVSGIITTHDILKIFKKVIDTDIQTKATEKGPMNEFLAKIYASPMSRIFEMLSNSGI
jgi:CBS domain-containing protein